jgi:ubiquinone biosynthesis protein UbiJ
VTSGFDDDLHGPGGGTSTGFRQVVALLADGLGEFANATLHLDPVGAARLAALEGCRILVRARNAGDVDALDAPMNEGPAFTLQIAGGRLRILAAATPTPNVVVSGSITELLTWAGSFGRRSPAGLRIDGDGRVLETLADIVGGYRPDFEAPLGRVIGTENATRVIAAAEVAIAGIRSLLQGTSHGLRRSAGQWFATRGSLSDFLDELGDAELQVDRLSARVEQLERGARKT